MGYTHYWDLPVTLKANRLYVARWPEFRSAASDVISYYLANIGELAYEYNQPDKAPQCDDEAIHFNGVGEDGHETFYLPANPLLYALECDKNREYVNETGFEFCKTARKPYDTAVCAILAIAVDMGLLRVSSDGMPPGDPPDWPEWINGEELLRMMGYDKAKTHHLERNSRHYIVWIKNARR